MVRQISQHELRDNSDEIVRALEQGESFVLTRDGVTIAELVPSRRQFVPTETLQAALRGLPPVDAAALREEIDQILDQDPTPRG